MTGGVDSPAEFIARPVLGMTDVLDSGPFDRPFDKLMVLSEVEGLTALSHSASSSWPRGKFERLRRNDE